MNTFAKYFRLYGSYLGLLGFLVLLSPENFRNFGGIAWQLLMFIMFLSPLTKVFPRWTWLARLMPLRRQFGIIIGALVIAHGVGASIVGYEAWKYITTPSHMLFWGMLAGISSLPLLLTSNNYSVKKLTKYWKVVQRLSYFMFIFGALHIYLVNPEKNFGVLVMVVVWMILKVLAANGVVIWKKKA